VDQLTLRGLDKEIERRIKELARRRGVSLNRAALELLRQGAGLGAPAARTNLVGDSLDHLIGSWSEDDARKVQQAVAALEKIDPGLWR